MPTQVSAELCLSFYMVSGNFQFWGPDASKYRSFCSHTSLSQLYPDPKEKPQDLPANFACAKAVGEVTGFYSAHPGHLMKKLIIVSLYLQPAVITPNNGPIRHLFPAFYPALRTYSPLWYKIT